ncbi:MAG: iron-sulfur cluster repair di-iron protein [Clostridiaceae bacterium]|nr:iron-sulfur cluster repair di-iron protein [Clostridiaceae bacterium]
MKKFDINQKLGDIAAEFPKAAELFREYKIDYCCGGNRALIEAIEEGNLNGQEIVDKLNDLYNEYASKNELERNWQEAPLNELVDHILNKHHAYLWAELPNISELTTKILRAHGTNHPEISKVHKLFHNLKMELESHLVKEEAQQYPAIRKYEESKVKNDLDEAIRVIMELEDEHTGAGDILKKLRKITDDYTVPDDGCPTYKQTYDKLQELESDMFEHIHLENNILFPRLFNLTNNSMR